MSQFNWQDVPREVAGSADIRDGDTIVVGGHRIRLEGIDAPERDQTCARGGRSWPCGRAAETHLARLIANHDVICRVTARDRFERLLGRCTVAGRDINRSMVRDGMAVAFANAYRADEAAARNSATGLWSGTFIRPADWRRANPR
ncbi:MAG: thermonuclease family protein [Alphaproteobacteria bacterium]|nr:thermonuclease family protein [Alphaproteobacteria bacterium]